MKMKGFYCYQSLNGSRQTISIRDLGYQKTYSITDVFYEIQNSDNEDDLLIRLSNIFKGNVTLGKVKDKKISYIITTEKLGRVILRIIFKKGTENG